MSRQVPPQLVERIRDTVLMDEVVEALDLGPLPSSRKLYSFRSAERTPSLHVYDYSWYDFSAGEGGDQIDFVMVATGAKFTKAVRFLQGRARLSASRVKRPKRTHTDLTGYYNGVKESDTLKIWHQFEDMLDRKWPTAKATTVLQHNKLTVYGELWTPHYHPEHETMVVGIKTRDLATGAKRSVPRSTYLQLYGHGYGGHKTSSTVVIVEGESDVWALRDLYPNLEILGLPSGAGTVRAEWFQRFSSQQRLYLALDGDEAGQKATEKIVSAIEWLNEQRHNPIQAPKIIDVPGGRVAEALGEGWRLSL